mgnify:CR=1 FL=1
MDIQTKLMQLLKFLLPAIAVSSLLAVFVSWKFDNPPDELGKVDSFEEILKDDLQTNIIKYSIIMLGVFTFVQLIVKQLKK